MGITIVKGSMDYKKDCEEALIQSELGRRYFSREGSASKALEDGFAKEEIFVALDTDCGCKGFIWYIPDGAFHGFPYVHIIAVKEECRNQGIGSKLLSFVEEVCLTEDYMKLFLVVADFNPEAKKLYERIGYTEVGVIPSLYREGITEYLMMKRRNV